MNDGCFIAHDIQLEHVRLNHSIDAVLECMQHSGS